MPEEVLQAQPELSFLYALTIMFTTDRRSPASWSRIEPFLQWAEQGFEAKEQRKQLGEALQLHAELAFFQEDLVRMFALLHQAQPFLTEHSIITQEATPPLKDALLLEPLSEQEQRVFPLLVARRSNPEIARALMISLNTVKTHIQSLYGKLNVHNRVEASEVARRLSLL